MLTPILKVSQDLSELRQKRPLGKLVKPLQFRNEDKVSQPHYLQTSRYVHLGWVMTLWYVLCLSKRSSRISNRTAFLIFFFINWPRIWHTLYPLQITQNHSLSKFLASSILIKRIYFFASTDKSDQCVLSKKGERKWEAWEPVSKRAPKSSPRAVHACAVPSLTVSGLVWRKNNAMKVMVPDFWG